MGARILVADDSVTIQKVVELTFSKEDFVLTQARNGEEAIRKAKEMRPDLVLLDLVMPDMNGYDVCAALRTEPALRSVPIILLRAPSNRSTSSAAPRPARTTSSPSRSSRRCWSER